MTNRSLTTLSALALGLSIAASTASAQPYGKGGNYSLTPAPRAQPRHGGEEANCGCPMMKGDGAMRDMCMGMTREHRGDEGAKPGHPG